MGCVSSKLFRKEFDKEIQYTNHIVSLTSSTYGALKLDQEHQELKISPPRDSICKTPKKKIVVEDPEVINAWELMVDLEDSSTPPSSKKSPKETADTGSKNRSRFFTQASSPMQQQEKKKVLVGKENAKPQIQIGKGRMEKTPSPSPKQVLRPFNSTGNLRKRVVPTLRLPLKSTPLDLLNRNSFKVDSGNATSRRSLSPLFGPELIASFENGEEKIKKVVSEKVSESPKPKPRNSKAKEAELMLELFEEKCPNAGENSVIIYTTTLRGIRRTFEDCNIVRSIVESHQIQMFERDISMDSGYREELRVIMGKKDINVPVLFVKGRLIGGADVVQKLEEEGKLAVLFDGVAKVSAQCDGCAGMRFVMCMGCSGSCKVMDKVERKMVKCSKCNENGLIHCPICS